MATKFKMWILILSIFVFAQGGLAELNCSSEPLTECDRPKLLSYIPSELSEFNKLCPEIPAFLRCLKEYQDNCEDMDYFESQGYYDGVYDAFSDLCEEGTTFNTGAREHLKCFNETFSKTSCPEKMKTITGPYRKVEKITEDEYQYTLPIDIMCLQDILESSCVAAEIEENCGQAALKVTLEFLRKISYVEEVCGKRSAEDLLEKLDEFALTQEQKELIIVTLESIIISNGEESP